jgi:hypothetical protein
MLKIPPQEDIGEVTPPRKDIDLSIRDISLDTIQNITCYLAHPIPFSNITCYLAHPQDFHHDLAPKNRTKKHRVGERGGAKRLIKIP